MVSQFPGVQHQGVSSPRTMRLLRRPRAAVSIVANLALLRWRGPVVGRESKESAVVGSRLRTCSRSDSSRAGSTVASGLTEVAASKASSKKLTKSVTAGMP